jgi:hypothetical protein
VSYEFDPFDEMRELLDDKSDSLAAPLVAKNIQLTSELDQASASLSGDATKAEKLALRKQEVFANNGLMLEMFQQIAAMKAADFPVNEEQQDEKNWGPDLSSTAELLLAKTLPHLLRRREIGADGEAQPLSGAKREALTRQALIGWSLFNAALSGREIDLTTSAANADQIIQRAKPRRNPAQ